MHAKQTSLCTFLLEQVIHFSVVETCDAPILLGTVTQPLEWGAPLERIAMYCYNFIPAMYADYLLLTGSDVTNQTSV